MNKVCVLKNLNVFHPWDNSSMNQLTHYSCNIASIGAFWNMKQIFQIVIWYSLNSGFSQLHNCYYNHKFEIRLLSNENKSTEGCFASIDLITFRIFPVSLVYQRQSTMDKRGPRRSSIHNADRYCNNRFCWRVYRCSYRNDIDNVEYKILENRDVTEKE